MDSTTAKKDSYVRNKSVPSKYNQSNHYMPLGKSEKQEREIMRESQNKGKERQGREDMEEAR